MARIANGGGAFNYGGSIFRNADVDLVELPVSFGVFVALYLWSKAQKLRECARDVGNGVETVIRNNPCIPKRTSDVEVVVEVEGSLEVLVLREAGASAVLGPFVLPKVLVWPSNIWMAYWFFISKQIHPQSSNQCSKA